MEANKQAVVVAQWLYQKTNYNLDDLYWLLLLRMNDHVGLVSLNLSTMKTLI